MTKVLNPIKIHRINNQYPKTVYFKCGLKLEKKVHLFIPAHAHKDMTALKESK